MFQISFPSGFLDFFVRNSGVFASTIYFQEFALILKSLLGPSSGLAFD